MSAYRLWGLEPNNTEEWFVLINSEIERHDAKSIQEWFHTIIYCINANTARIEEHEIELIQKLREAKNNLIIAITHCDKEDAEFFVISVKKRLHHLKLDEEKIVTICSINRTLLSGRIISPFGKNAIISVIQKDFWNKISNKLPIVITNSAKELVNIAEEECYKIVDKEIKFRNIHSNSNYIKINRKCEKIYEMCIQEINRLYDSKISEAIEYYIKVSDQLSLCTDNTNNAAYKKPEMKFIFYNLSIEDKLAENIAFVIMGIIPIINLMVPYAATEVSKDSYKKNLKSVSEQILHDIKNNEVQLYQFLSDLWNK